jgi:diguanylate cyclase (GGDEF)-like protein
LNQKVLVADDEVAVQNLISRALVAMPCEVVVASDGAQALDLVERVRPNLVVLDVDMPRKNGWQVLRQLRSQNGTRGLPVIMLTHRGDLASEVEGLEMGADDYIAKPFELEQLRARVMSVLRRNRLDLTANPLTHLPGSPGIEAEVQRRIKAGSPFAFLYADIDHFKPYNDTYGFARGDDAIRATAGVLLESLRAARPQEAFLGHVGGDDFVMMTDPASAPKAAQSAASLFDQKAAAFYDAEDASRGYIEAADRQGVRRCFSLMTLSIGAVTTEHRRLFHYGRVVALAAEMKTYCRTLADRKGSRFAFDRRQDPDV